MLSQFVGQIDFNAALVLVAAFVTSCIVITAMIVKRRSRLDINNEHELAKMKVEAENQRALFVVETDRAYKFKQIDKNLITSHRADED
jgi:hypothetical protein